MLDQRNQKIADITSHELECIMCLLEGQNTTQIASKLNISSEEAENYLENISRKIGCNDKYEIINNLKQFL